MQGELDSLYKAYKQGIKPAPDRKPLPRKAPTQQREIPNPLLDGEFEPDCTNVSTCSNCGSFNISIDMGTNKVICRECGEKADKASRVDFQKMMEKAREEEQNQIKDAIKRGDVFLK